MEDFEGGIFTSTSYELIVDSTKATADSKLFLEMPSVGLD